MEPIPVAASHPFVALKPVPQHIVLVHVLSPLTISFAYKLAYLYKAGFSHPTPPFPIAFTNETIPAKTGVDAEVPETAASSALETIR